MKPIYLTLIFTIIISRTAFAQNGMQIQNSAGQATKDSLTRSNGLTQRGEKKTGGGSRWYKYFNFIDEILGNPFSGSTSLTVSLPIWNDTGIKIKIDTLYKPVEYFSVSEVIDPVSDLFNLDTDLVNKVYGMPSGAGSMIRVLRGDNYFVDSISVKGIYYKVKPLRTDADSLILSVVPIKKPYKYVGLPWIPSFTLSDTIYAFAPQKVNSSLRTAMPDTSIYPGVTWAVPLTPGMAMDSIFDYKLGLPSSVSIPAGYLAAVTLTFKSTDHWSAGDTIYNYDRFMPLFGFEYEMPGGYMSYHRDIYQNDCNGAGLMHSVDPLTYTPSIADQGGGLPSTKYYLYEYAAIEALIRCNSCASIADLCCLDVNTVNKQINKATVYPNPADGIITISFAFAKQADINISIANAIGQVVRTK
ncbi:MAG: hypothetical protein JSS96_09070, partial [Bacteroidetes bacterium]|nr:hypothetical protein [Bacteroidota bacterium]